MKSIVRALGGLISGAFVWLGRAWRWLLCWVANLRRRLLRGRLPDYAVIALNQDIAERNPETPWWYGYIPGRKPAQSLESLAIALERIAGDPDVKGVLLLLREPGLSLAKAQSLAALLDRFRAWDEQANQDQERPPKRIVVHLESVNAAGYVAACAADLIAVTPLSTWDVVGLRVAPLFLKETLAKIGVQMDVIQIAPWKTAADSVSRASMSDEQRAQLTWLLDSLYADIVEAISAGRDLPTEQVRALIDDAPLSADVALSVGLVDSVCYEDELGDLLGDLLGEQDEPARLATFGKIHKLLLRTPRHPHKQSVGVISLSGAITSGRSRNFPLPLPIFGEQTIGSAAVQQLVRAARRDDRVGAVVLHVDSPGGSALASDLIWRELKLLDAEKPLVVYMGDVAASGGYYIAAPARKIVAQRATMTGSIGVITAKPVTGDALAKVGAVRDEVARGANVALYDNDRAWNEAERAKMRADIERVYTTFKDRVAEGRGLEFEGLDDICNGRVWTGKQGQVHGLIDDVGDFQAAVEWACQLAELPVDGRVNVENIAPSKSYLVPLAAQAAETWQDPGGLRQTARLASALAAGRWEELLGNERYWLIADGVPKV